jgi:NADH-quinone oxidoreductase subunit J
METAVFIVAAVMVIGGALGVVLRPNPVHCALSLILTLFGIAVLFIAQEANFLAAVQVIVYAGAIVVLFLFVIMLLGVDKLENLEFDELRGQRPLAAALGVVAIGLIVMTVFAAGGRRITGEHSVGGALSTGEPDINVLAKSLFSDYVFAFELTSLLLVIAVVATVLLARRPRLRRRPDDVATDAVAEPDEVRR